MDQAFLALVTIVIGVGGCVGYFWASNIILDKVIFPARGPQAGRNISHSTAVPRTMVNGGLDSLRAPCFYDAPSSLGSQYRTKGK